MYSPCKSSTGIHRNINIAIHHLTSMQMYELAKVPMHVKKIENIKLNNSCRAEYVNIQT